MLFHHRPLPQTTLVNTAPVPTNPNISPGIYLHDERTAGLTRADGTVPKPSLLERYLHRPLDPEFDTMDIVTYHSQHKMSKSPPQYAVGNTRSEKPTTTNKSCVLMRSFPTISVRIVCCHISGAFRFSGTFSINGVSFELCGSSAFPLRSIIGVSFGFGGIALFSYVVSVLHSCLPHLHLRCVVISILTKGLGGSACLLAFRVLSRHVVFPFCSILFVHHGR